MFSCSRPPKFRLLATALGLAFLGLATSRPAPAQVAVLTQNNDNARTGANVAEPTLTPANVTTSTFGKLFTITGLNANVNGQVLYVPGVTVNGVVHNVVYAYTSNNANNSSCGLYAFDADTGAQVWSPVILPNSAQYTTACPVIDPATLTIYLLTKSTDDSGATYLRAYDITSGAAKGSIQIQASAPGTGAGSVNGTVYFDGNHGNGTFHANDRAALLLLNGVVYTSFAFNTDAPPYHGSILGYSFNGASFTQKYVFCTTPDGSDGGIWQAGKGLMADAAGNIYCSVGNGTFDANTKGITSGTDYGMCYLKLSPSLQVLDWYAPYDEAAQSNADNDLGNSGPVGIPGTMDLFAGATKFGAGFLLNSANMGHFPSSAANETAVQRLNLLSGNDNVGQNPIAWDTGTYKYVYIWPSGNNIEQFRYDPSVGNFNPPTPATNTSTYPAAIYKQTASQTAGGALAISSRGTSNAILWAVGPHDSSSGALHAFNAADVSQPELWDSGMNASRDALGSVGHFQFPTVANGKVYVPTGSSSIVVYGLLANPAPTLPVFRLYDPFNGDHFYTINGAEENVASEYGYSLEGVIGYAPAFGASGTGPVYRLYYPPTGEHFYTNNAAEEMMAVSYGYRYEGIGFDVLTSSGTGLPLYRLYSPDYGKHFYTTNASEEMSLVNSGFWNYEGILGNLYAP